MSADRTPSVLDVYAARHRLRPYLAPTPLLHSSWLSGITGADVYLKVESLQPARSFKIRGAYNAALQITQQDGPRPTIVTASAGNHGRAIAEATERLGLRAVVYTPRTAPANKKAAIRAHAAELRDGPADYDEAELEAKRFATEQGAVYVSPYNDADVIAGAGTIALELMEVLPRLDVVVVPLGGGGLASGIGLALKSVAPHVAVVGVEVEASTAFATSAKHGRITTIDVGPSLADGLVGNLEPGSVTFELVQRHVDRLTSVSEEALAKALVGLAAEEHLIAEGAGATATAGVLARQIVQTDQRVAVLVTGGNIDLHRFAAVLAR